MTDPQWYYAGADRQRVGPVDAGAIRAGVAEGRIGTRTLVWRQGMSQWAPLAQHADELGLMPPEVAAPPVAAPTTPVAAIEPEPVAGELAPSGRSEAVPPSTPPERPSIHGRAVFEARDPAPAPAYDEARVQAAYAARHALDPTASTGFRLEARVVDAGFLKRVAASIIDSLVLGIAAGVIGGVFGAMLGLGGSANSTIEAVGNVLGIILSIAYYGGFHSSESQATPGKMLIGIKVARPDGERLSFARAALRVPATWLNMLTLGIGWLLPLFTQRKQALHDLVCDTVVVDRWAYTDQPERQSEELSGCAIAVLIVGGLLVVFSVVAIAIGVAALGNARWN